MNYEDMLNTTQITYSFIHIYVPIIWVHVDMFKKETNAIRKYKSEKTDLPKVNK